MKILDVLKKQAVLADLKSRDKKGIVEELSEPVAGIAGVSHDELVRILMEREQLGSTAIGGGIGIPHGKMKGLESLAMGVGLSRRGVEFESIDGRLTHIFFLLLAPENSTGLHLKCLAQVSRMLKSEPFKERLLNSGTSDEIFNIIRSEDEEF
ncbi:PTS sugar transporter subunit IIA [Desulfococcaceae bacterium HSG8]|nr:PTS sugar transporter subunit IIA [Desulfococcaceae bacterium HSG8]